MKLKQYIYLTNAQAYLSGTEPEFTVSWNEEYEDSDTFPHWIYIMPIVIEFPFDISYKDITQKVLDQLGTEETRLRAKFQNKLNNISDRRAKALAIPHLKSEGDKS